MLLFKQKFLEAIRSGEKCQTIRLWKYRRMKAGQRSYIPGVGYIAITCVERVELDDLTDADAVLDGFQTADMLREEIYALYGVDALKRLRAYIIEFRVYPPNEQQAIAAEQEKKRADKKARQQLFRRFVFM